MARLPKNWEKVIDETKKQRWRCRNFDSNSHWREVIVEWMTVGKCQYIISMKVTFDSGTSYSDTFGHPQNKFRVKRKVKATCHKLIRYHETGYFNLVDVIMKKHGLRSQSTTDLEMIDFPEPSDMEEELEVFDWKRE